MSEWQVSLIFQDEQIQQILAGALPRQQSGSQFWPDRHQGQSQAKRYDSPEDAASELQKQAREKYKKGYVDGDGGPNEATSATAATATDAALPAPTQCALDADHGRTTAGTAPERRGNALHTHSIEHYPNADAASAALAQIRAALEADGYRAQ
jgi:hypothetical protein